MEKSKIIAVDFDGTLCTNKFPEIGEPIHETIEALKSEQAAGARVILWTCRVGERLTETLLWCGEHGIDVDEVNRNLPDIVDSFGSDCRKIFADEYWDDRAVRKPDNKVGGEHCKKASGSYERPRKDSIFIGPVRKLCMSALLAAGTIKFIKWVW